ncbi:MAG: hypothetical protein JST86_05480 [Bacteroidetes bacterium]|nr:hypothetical protein [Bacteroidota bacterium]
MNKFLLFLFIAACFVSCNVFSNKTPLSGADEKRKLMEADMAFSNLSAAKGMKAAFIEYLDSNGVLLRPNNFPIVGADAIDYLLQLNDSAYTLIWEPKNGAIARSGELGYTYGEYRLKPSSKDTVIFGTYVSIWKKQADGKWKFVLDSGNEGLGKATDSAQ